jgi:glycosyltransferase involved in cell wall biosynthesis
MNLDSAKTANSLWLVWVYPIDVFRAFNAAPRLEVTKEMRKLGWQVDLIACGPVGKHLVQGVEVLCFPWPNIYLLRQFIFHFYILRYVLQNWQRIDAVLLTQLSAAWLLPLKLLYPFGKKHPLFIMDTRTVPMETIKKATLKDKLRGKFYFLMNNLANKFADGQTAITQRMADLLFIPAEKLWGVWPSGVNAEEFSGALEKRRWPGQNDSIKLIYIGILHYERNLMTLCRAVLEANRQGMNFTLQLYGDGTEKEDLKAFTRESNGIIAVYDTVPHPQVPEVLAGAHVGVLPFPDEDKYRVSSPIKLFEYMGAGLPILATEIVCHTDVIGAGEYVFWAKNANIDGLLAALQKTWQEKSSLSTMGEKALSAAPNWTYQASAMKLNLALRHGLGLNPEKSI